MMDGMEVPIAERSGQFIGAILIAYLVFELARNLYNLLTGGRGR